MKRVFLHCNMLSLLPRDARREDCGPASPRGNHSKGGFCRESWETPDRGTLARVDVRIEPQPTEDERLAILTALAAAPRRNLLAPLSVEEACAVAAENIPPGLPTNPSARSA